MAQQASTKEEQLKNTLLMKAKPKLMKAKPKPKYKVMPRKPLYKAMPRSRRSKPEVADPDDIKPKVADMEGAEELEPEVAGPDDIKLDPDRDSLLVELWE